MLRAVYQGFACVLKSLEIFEFQESDFMALKVLEISFWSLEVLDFFMEQDRKIFNACKLYRK